MDQRLTGSGGEILAVRSGGGERNCDQRGVVIKEAGDGYVCAEKEVSGEAHETC